MKWQFTARVDTRAGSYDVQFRNLDTPGGGIDFAVAVTALRRVLDDLDRRRKELVKGAPEGAVILAPGDDDN